MLRAVIRLLNPFSLAALKLVTSWKTENEGVSPIGSHMIPAAHG